MDRLEVSLSGNCVGLLENLTQAEERIDRIFEAASIEEVSFLNKIIVLPVPHKSFFGDRKF